MRQLTIGLPIAASLLLSGCATRTPALYYWGDYQPEVYGYFTKDKAPAEQIANLEAGLERSRASGRQVPPGYNAHLGLLYAQSEQPDQMVKYFAAEKDLYPEATTYMDFLLRNLTPPR